MFQLQNDYFNELGLIQLIEFPTWQRVINNVLKESTLDHIYVQDPTIVVNISSKTPLIGDHKIIIINVTHKSQKVTPLLKETGAYT